MAIPDFQSLMLPLLCHLQDGRERTNQETLEALAQEFGLTEQEREELLPSGRQPVFTNRVAWAKVHLKAARLIESPRRGVYKIAARGLEILKQKPERVDLRLLRTFPEYQEWRTPRPDEEEDIEKGEDALTPEEHLEYGYQKLREDLASDLLRRVREASPAFFERLVVDLLVAMGYGGSRRDAAQTLGRSGDGGIDGVIKEDPLGLDVIYLQAKRWDGTIGRPEVQKFAGALQGQRARKGVFITTSDFSKEAEEYAASIDSRIVLINGRRLAGLMIDHAVGVTQAGSYDIRRIDSDYFEES
jgi:restriction system protein